MYVDLEPVRDKYTFGINTKKNMHIFMQPPRNKNSKINGIKCQTYGYSKFCIKLPYNTPLHLRAQQYCTAGHHNPADIHWLLSSYRNIADSLPSGFESMFQQLMNQKSTIPNLPFHLLKTKSLYFEFVFTM